MGPCSWSMHGNATPLSLTKNDSSRSSLSSILPLTFSISPDAENLNDSLFYGDEENNGSEQIRNEVNGNCPASSINEAKLHAKAKRRLRKNSSRDSGRGDSVSDNGENARGVLPTSPNIKLMDRKSRSGKGRGLPKKGLSSTVPCLPLIILYNRLYLLPVQWSENNVLAAL